MRKIMILLALALLCGCAAEEMPVIEMCSPKPVLVSDISYRSEESPPKTDKYTPLCYEEQHAVWITYIELAELFAEESSEEDLRRDSDRLFSRLAELGFNTVYLHVRAFGDAFYDSELFAPTRYLAFSCDPLAVMLDTAHDHKLAVHAWINPLRCETEGEMWRSEGTLIGEWYENQDRYESYIVRPENDEHYWLNPGVPEVRKLVADGVNKLHNENNALLIITHHLDLLNHIQPDIVHIYADGHIVKSGDKSLAVELEKSGYKTFVDAE